MTVRFILYAILAIIFQVGLGMLTGMGQGSTGLLVFVVLVELDPNFSFTYLVQNNVKGDKNE